MQTAQLRLYQGRFFLIPAGEVEAFDKYRDTLESNNSTAEFAQVHIAFVDRYAMSEITSKAIDRVYRIDRVALKAAIVGSI
jgi:hypothetical protein